MSDESALLCYKTWARDYAIVGLLSGGLAPYFVLHQLDFSLGAAVFGAVGGAVLGLLSASLLQRHRRKLPLVGWLFIMPSLGVLWGAFAGLGGGAFTGHPEDVMLGMVFGAVGGMLQLSWFFPVYLFQSVRGGLTLPVLGAGLLMTSVLGWLPLALLLMWPAGLFPFLVLATVAMSILLGTIHQSERRAADNLKTAMEVAAKVGL